MTPASGIAGWRLALRLAWREAWRAKGRSALVLVMVTFPVIAVVAADIAQATSSVSSVEGLDRRIGASQALVTALPHTQQVFQTADPDAGGMMARTGGHQPAVTWSELGRAAGGSRPATELRTRQVSVHTELGLLDVDATGVDLTSPLAKGLFRVTSGRAPKTHDEVAMNAALAANGFRLGDTLSLSNGRRVVVVGTAESTGARTSPLLVGQTSWLPPTPAYGVRQWLIGGDPVTWDDVRALNALGATVVSREVIEHPPSTAQLPPQLGQAIATDRSQIYTVLALIGVMALLEVVLLAGPAFAVGARRQSRTLALLAANGGTPRQSRRTVLAMAVVLGTVGALAGVVLGLLGALVLVPLLQAHADSYFGPFQVRWPHVWAVAAFGLVSALLAAVVPAWIASRQDVVAVLAGRRGDRKAGLRSPVVGVLLLGVGVVLAVLGARQGAGELLIAAAAVVSVFGMIFLVPLVVVAVARIGRVFPLPLRYAVRDAARHRTRTVPAVAAVAATVAGVVALAIGYASDQAQAEADYRPIMAQGQGYVMINAPGADWPAATAAVARVSDAARVAQVRGVLARAIFGVHAPGPKTQPVDVLSPFAAQIFVSRGGDDGVQAMLAPILTSDEQAQVRSALTSGRAVVFTRQPVTGDQVRLDLGPRRLHAPAAFLAVGSRTMPTAVVMPPAVAHDLGVRSPIVGLALSGTPLTTAQEGDLRQVLSGVDQASYLYVERGYQTPNTERIVLWILFGLAGVLMLGGTLTATFLALSDARPDLATLSAIGAAPRTRRGVAAAYALSVGAVGALLGAAVGFIPGIAISFPLTRGYLPGAPAHYLEIPWTVIVALVVALPVVTALVVGLTARSRLPLVARLD